ncbi:helix-hairpin-helix domain-containing protein [Arthrobacter sp. JSM 101049]|uniref:helix-hairpin-helix domain-containing protein n=1 Tax=Arthrobacter sp. JSM 101049 TaxID=929097 RepID=UPI0035684DF1
MVRHRWESRSEEPRGGERDGGVRFRFRLGRGAIMCLLFTAVIWIAASLLFNPPQGSGERIGAVDMDPSSATGSIQPSPGTTDGVTATPSSPETAGNAASAASTQDTASTAPTLVVHVAGAVREPGVYHFGPGARAGDAVRSAGGLTPDAVASAVNLAAPLQDGQQLYLPTRDELAAGTVPAPGADGAGAPQPASGQPLNINTASEAELQELPGIGPALSARIVEFRNANGPFGSLDELDAVSGIGPSLMSQLKPLVRMR